MLINCWNILCQLAPWLLLGMFLSGLLHVALPSGFIRRKFRGLSGIFKAVMFGVPLPLCSCGVVPAGIGLKNQGASDGASVGFLISTPQTGIDSVLVSASFFGWPFALFKVLAAAVTGVFGGWIADRTASSSGKLEVLPTSSNPHEHSHVPNEGPILLRLWLHSLDIFKSIWGWIVIGVLVSAAIEGYVPKSWFSALGEMGLFPAMVAVLAVSAPLYVCATASVPIAAALVSAGLPPAAALVFLMAGPATNVTTIGAIYGRFGWKTLTVYLVTIIAGSMLFAWAFDWLLPASSAQTGNAHNHHYQAWWATVSAIALLLMIGWFIWSDARNWLDTRRLNKETDRLEIKVEGMTCGGCVNKLRNGLQKRVDVETVSVQLEPGLARITGKINLHEAEHAIEELGFRVSGA